MVQRKRSSKSGAKAKKPALTIVESKATPKNIPSNASTQKSEPVAVAITEVRLAPELEAQIKRPSQAVAVTPPVDPRIQAREERMKRKQETAAALQAQREANNAVVKNVTVPENAAEPRPSSPGSSNGHLTIAIPETLKYKVLFMEAEYKKVSEPIRQNLKMIAQAKLAEDIKRAVLNDEKCKSAATALESCVNEILDTIQNQMPPGYAAVFCNTKEGQVICKHAPQLAGKRFQLG